MSTSHVAIVTGAGSGIGAATAALLAEAGWAIALVGRDETKLQRTIEQVTEQLGESASLLPVTADVCKPEDIERMVQTTLDQFGRIDAIANIAGNAPLHPIDQITYEGWRACIDTNLTSVVMITRALWPTFKKQKSGMLVNVSSMASISPFPNFSIYAAAKVGVNMFTKCTADEGGKCGIKAVAIAPGAVETDMLRAIFDEKIVPREKTLAPMDVAAAIRDCMTGKRNFKNGETITMPSP